MRTAASPPHGRPMFDSPSALARLSLSCLDLTSLNEGDGEAQVEALCRRARTPYGTAAAVCVWPQLARSAVRCCGAALRAAAVANFPAGGADERAVEREVAALAEQGVHEVDLVLPWRALAAGDLGACSRVVRAARRAAAGLTLKLIIESGELALPALIVEACRLGIGEGADFLKTSTGKTPTGATPEAAELMLRSIAADAAARTRVGFKASGGIRSVADAAVYIRLAAHVLGAAALGPSRLRIGASALLADIEAVLAGDARAAGGTAPRRA